MRATSSALGLWKATLVLVAVVLAAGPARAQDLRHVEPPAAPEEHRPTISVEVHGLFEAPIERSAICPSSTACVLGLGIGIGAKIERRGPDRVGLFGAYDLWLLDSNGVFELGALHASRVGVRYVLDDTWLVHPFIEGGIGLVAFGDTGRVSTLGGVITAGGGAELELTESVAVVAAAETWLFAMAPFDTRDSITRADPFGVNLALQITLGISVLVGPFSAPR